MGIISITGIPPPTTGLILLSLQELTPSQAQKLLQQSRGSVCRKALKIVLPTLGEQKQLKDTVPAFPGCGRSCLKMCAAGTAWAEYRVDLKHTELRKGCSIY